MSKKSQPVKDVIEYDGFIWTRYPNRVNKRNGLPNARARYYYIGKANTSNALHRYIYIKHHGEIPRRWVVLHKDADTSNIDINNLELISRSEFQRRFKKSFIEIPEVSNTRNITYNECRKCGKKIAKHNTVNNFCSLSCRNKFNSRKNYQKYKNKIVSKKTCEFCGKKFSVNLFQLRKGIKTCSKECTGKLGRKTKSELQCQE